MSDIEFVLSPPEALERLRDAAEAVVDLAGTSAAVRARLAAKGAELGVHPSDAAVVLDEVFAAAAARPDPPDGARRPARKSTARRAPAAPGGGAGKGSPPKRTRPRRSAAAGEAMPERAGSAGRTGRRGEVEVPPAGRPRSDAGRNVSRRAAGQPARANPRGAGESRGRSGGDVATSVWAPRLPAGTAGPDERGRPPGPPDGTDAPAAGHGRARDTRRRSTPPVRPFARIRLTAGSESQELVVIPPGTFLMGSPESEPERAAHETQHRVTLTRAFALGVKPVSQEFFQSVSRRFVPMARAPVTMVSWFDAVAFCNAVSRREKLRPAYRIVGRQVEWDVDAPGYRLPTEAEWEYACRAGTTGPNYWSGPVRRRGGHDAPNEWGLDQMLFPRLDWCWDGFGTYGAHPVTDPHGGRSGTRRVARGGGDSWGEPRAAQRRARVPGCAFPDVGIRLARTVSVPTEPW